MGRNKTVDRDALAVFLKEKLMPVLTEQIALSFGVCRKTASHACRDAREKDGYPIYPTQNGQYYMNAIRNAADMSMMLTMQDWSAMEGASMKKLNRAAQTQIQKKTDKK